MLALLPLLLEIAPTLAGLIAGKKAEDAAALAVQVAQQVVPGVSPAEAVGTLGTDPAKAEAFRLALEEQRFKFAALELEETKAYLGDTQDARARDIALAEKGYRNSRANTMLAGAGIIVIGILVLIVLKSPLDDYVKTTITLILGRALGYVDAGFNFEFGTTRSSGKKDDTISTLSAR